MMEVDKAKIEAELLKLNEAIRQKPNDTKAYNERGMLYIKLERWTDAFDDFSQAIDLKASEVYYLNRAFVLQKLDNALDALVDCDTAISLNPQKPIAYYQRSQLLRILERYEEAQQAIDKAIALDEKNAAYHFASAVINAKLKNWDGIIGSLERVLELDPGNKDAESRLKDFKEIRKMQGQNAKIDSLVNLLESGVGFLRKFTDKPKNS